MDLAKVIKGYFVFLMCIVTIGALSYNDTVKQHMLAALSAMHLESNTNTTNQSLYASVYSLDSIKEKIFATDNLYENNNPNAFGFSLSNDPENSFQEPGTKGALIMYIDLSAYENKAVLKDLRFRVYGVDNYKVENVFIEVNGDILDFGKRDGEYFNFKNLDYEIKSNTKIRFAVKVDLDEELNTGNRLRLDIEKPEDITIKVDGENLSVNDYYPIKGTYLSIGKARPDNSPKND